MPVQVAAAVAAHPLPQLAVVAATTTMTTVAAVVATKNQ